MQRHNWSEHIFRWNEIRVGFLKNLMVMTLEFQAEKNRNAFEQQKHVTAASVLKSIYWVIPFG